MNKVLSSADNMRNFILCQRYVYHDIGKISVTVARLLASMKYVGSIPAWSIFDIVKYPALTMQKRKVAVIICHFQLQAPTNDMKNTESEKSLQAQIVERSIVIRRVSQCVLFSSRVNNCGKKISDFFEIVVSRSPCFPSLSHFAKSIEELMQIVSLIFEKFFGQFRAHVFFLKF